jgi:SAM-dependent methyltransferase
MAVNVLHHVGDDTEQAAALAELARVVRAGGRVVVHEINTTNPLFRLYMVYLFPLWKRIDVGTESWLDPARLPTPAGLRLVDAHFYTFVPDFAPAWLYRSLAWLEARLERSAWARYGAHFTLVYARSSDSRPGRDAERRDVLAVGGPAS